MAKGDYNATSQLRPLHFTVAVREDGSANTSVGLVADVVNPDTGNVIASGRNFELDLSPDERDALSALVRRLGDDAVATEGLAGLVPPPAPAGAAAPGQDQPPAPEQTPQG